MDHEQRTAAYKPRNLEFTTRLETIKAAVAIVAVTVCAKTVAAGTEPSLMV
jgi:hypothetical protein